MIDLRLGRYQDVLGDVECDAVICDPPYSARNHRGHDSIAGFEARDGHAREQIDYSHWTADEVSSFVATWSPRTRGWIVALTSHDLIPAWEAAFDEAGRLAFAPVPCVIRGMTFRMLGDGPSSWAVYAMVARPRTRAMQAWGTLPGAYVVGKAHAGGGGGGRGKPIDLMRALVRDYSRPSDLVCDPCAGYATTGVAALGMGRQFVGAEMDEAAHAQGCERLEAVTPVTGLFDERGVRQQGLFGEGGVT